MTISLHLSSGSHAFFRKLNRLMLKKLCLGVFLPLVDCLKILRRDTLEMIHNKYLSAYSLEFMQRLEEQVCYELHIIKTLYELKIKT